MNWKNLTFGIFISLSSASHLSAQSPKAFENPVLFAELKAKDSLIFELAFRTCDAERLTEIYSKDFVMFYDRGINSPSTSQTFSDFQQRVKNTCAGKSKSPAVMRRIIKPGTLQAFQMTGTTASQTGVQQFFMKQASGEETMVEESKFTRFWTKTATGWRISSETDFLINADPEVSAKQRYQPKPYAPASKTLYATIVKMDSIYFDTYNTSKPALMDSLTAEDIEFYHDRGGLSTSKAELLASIKKNIFGKVTRILTPNSIEVYEIPGYGAVEFGYHSFRNIAEPGQSDPSKFVMLWRLKNGKWQMTRVISLH